MTSPWDMMQWFKKHPELLQAESYALATDSNYKEIIQVRDRLFLSHGHIVVRLDKVYLHPVLIIYTDATPYHLPLIVPLKEELEELTVELFASMPLHVLYGQLRTHVQFFHKLRHQGSNGALCILEWDTLDSGSEFYAITTILKRVRQWYEGHITGVFPPDSQEIEFVAHFNDVDYSSSFLYPQAFLDDSITAGYFYATNVAVSKGSVYFGSLFDGIGKSGLITGNSKYLLNDLIDPTLTNALAFQTEVDRVNKYVAENVLIYGSWFDLKTPLLPFESFSDLIKIIGDGNFEAGVRRFETVSLHYFKTQAPDKIIIGVRFPNLRGVLEFQVFRIYKKAAPPGLLLRGDAYERMLSILNSYERVVAMPGDKFTKASFHIRNGSRVSQEVLETKVVNMLGVGAIGGEVADIMGKAGVGNMGLLDNQSIRPENPVRHVAGINYVGAMKVDAVADILKHHNPFIKVYAKRVDLYTLNVFTHFHKDAWSISSVADDNLEGFLNEQAVIAGQPVFYVRALRGGKVGRIFRVIPGTDACFRCLTLYDQEQKEFVRIPPDPENLTLFNECNNPVRPASAADLKTISAIASGIILNQLQAPELPAQNHWIWSTEEITGLPAIEKYKLHEQSIRPHPKCPFCNHDSKLSVDISASTLADMQKLVAEKKGIETGGVLAGRRDEAGNITVTHASGPGPMAIHKPTEFHKDIDFCQQFLDKLLSESGGDIVYVGEWHSHPASDNKPSGIDLMSLSQIASQTEYLTINPVMIIFSSDGKPSCTIHPAGKIHYFTDLKTVNKEHEHAA